MLAGIAALMSASAATQTYPAKPVRLIVPFSAGSGSDIIARTVAGGLAEVVGQQVVIDNRAGAAGNIGAELAARAAPDGYTVLFGNVAHAANVSIYPKLPYDFVRDFAPVTLLGSSPAILVVHPSLPVKSVAELVKLAKQRPGAINYASGGTGTPTYLATELFKRQAAIDLVQVPYRAGGEALTSILSGETSVYFAPLAAGIRKFVAAQLAVLPEPDFSHFTFLFHFDPTIALGDGMELAKCIGKYSQTWQLDKVTVKLLADIKKKHAADPETVGDVMKKELNLIDGGDDHDDEEIDSSKKGPKGGFDLT